MTSRTYRRLGVLAGLLLVSVTAALLLLGPEFVRAAYAGRSWTILNGVISGQGRHSIDTYVEAFRHTVIAASVAAGLVAVGVWWFSDGGRRVPRGRAVAVVLGIMALTIAGSRATTMDEAVDRDVAAYAVLAEGLLRGQPLYSELWDHKPPAVHLTYSAAIALFGMTPVALWAMSTVAAIVTLLGCYRAAERFGGARAGLFAAGVWVLVSGDLLLEANQPNVEVFMNAFLVWAFVLVLQPPERGSARRYAVAGALFFLASFYKPVVAAVAVAIVLASTLVATGGRVARWRSFGPFGYAAIAGGVVTLGWALVLGYFWAVGRLAPFYEAVVSYNRDYAGSIGANVMASLMPTVDALRPLLPYVPLVLAIGATLVASLFRRTKLQPWQAVPLLAYLAGSWIAVALPGRLYPHYFQLLLPAVAIGAAALLASVPERHTFLWASLLGCVLFGPLAARTYQAFIPVSEIPIAKYGRYGYDCLETQRMSDWINGNFGAGAVVYHWGPDPGVYFYAQRPSPVGMVYNMPLTDGTERAVRYSNRVLEQLRDRSPDLVVARRLDMLKIDNVIEEWLVSHYTSIDGPSGVDRFVFMVRSARPE